MILRVELSSLCRFVEVQEMVLTVFKLFRSEWHNKKKLLRKLLTDS